MARKAFFATGLVATSCLFLMACGEQTTIAGPGGTSSTGGGSGGSGGSEGGSGGDGEGCTADRVECGSSCVDTQNDPAHCGACDAACLDQQQCVEGKCAGTACTPDETKECYGGPEGTAGVGICAAGKQICNAGGTAYGPCEGEVLPAPSEACGQGSGDGKDDDCNGKVDDGCKPPVGESCRAIQQKNPALPDGLYQLDPDGKGGEPAYDAYCDMTTDGGGWTLVLAYGHQGGQNDPLKYGVVPTDPTTGYSHMSTDQVKALGPLTETRVYCDTSAHPRKIHFRATAAGLVDYFRGTGDNNVSFWTMGVVTLAGHDAMLPAATTAAYTTNLEERMTYAPFYVPFTIHWDIRGEGHRWECDDFVGFSNGFMNTTTHRIWLR